MRIQQWLLFSALTVALSSVSDVAVYGQGAPRSRGSVKVQARFFNPFDVGPSRLTLNPFGVFSLAQPTSLAAPSVVVPTSDTPEPAFSEGRLGVSSGSLLRPPYRPPVRSPFRPPPRPPF